MKRSEIVEKIAEHLITNCNIFGGDQEERNAVRESTKMYRLKLAHEMLFCTEDEGMKPPEYLEKGCLCGSCYVFYEWEPE